jgi:hypothetical protein
MSPGRAATFASLLATTTAALTACGGSNEAAALCDQVGTKVQTCLESSDTGVADEAVIACLDADSAGEARTILDADCTSLQVSLAAVTQALSDQKADLSGFPRVTSASQASRSNLGINFNLNLNNSNAAASTTSTGLAPVYPVGTGGTTAVVVPGGVTTGSYVGPSTFTYVPWGSVPVGTAPSSFTGPACWYQCSTSFNQRQSDLGIQFNLAYNAASQRYGSTVGPFGSSASAGTNNLNIGLGVTYDSSSSSASQSSRAPWWYSLATIGLRALGVG